MQKILFIISSVFSLIFYLFYRFSIWENLAWSKINNSFQIEAFSWNLLIETISFLLIWFFLYFYFWDFSAKNKNKTVDLKLLKKIIINFFSKYLYYIWIFLFYLGLYLILNSIWFTNYSIIIFIINIIVLSLFFIKHKFFIFRDFIKINVIFFSIYYLIYYILSFIAVNPEFSIYDFINWIIILIFFLLNIYADKKILNRKKSDKAIVFYFFIYLFLFSWFYLINLITNISILFSFLWFIFSFSIYFIFLKINFFENSKIVLKKIGLIFLYISSISGIYYIYNNDFNLFILSLLFYSLIFNIIVHYKYQNYISFIIALLSWLFLSYSFYFEYLFIWENKENNFLILSLTISLIFIFITYLRKLKYYYDYYLLHVFWYLINILWTVYYFSLIWFDIFYFWIIILFNSFYVFLSYYKLKSIR